MFNYGNLEFFTNKNNILNEEEKKKKLKKNIKNRKCARANDVYPTTRIHKSGRISEGLLEVNLTAGSRRTSGQLCSKSTTNGASSSSAKTDGTDGNRAA